MRREAWGTAPCLAFLLRELSKLAWVAEMPTSGEALPQRSVRLWCLRHGSAGLRLRVWHTSKWVGLHDYAAAFLTPNGRHMSCAW